MTLLRVESLKRDAEQIEEDYPGQKREFFREKAIQLAVELADRVIMECSDGSVEETDFLTGEVARRFVDKVGIGLSARLSRKELLERSKGKG